MPPRLPPYFDGLIAARRSGHVGRHVHLGFWDDPPDLAAPCAPGEFEAAQARLTERMLDLVSLRSHQTVLDVACGFGGLMAAIDRRFDDMALTGLNIDMRQLDLCRGAVVRSGNRLTQVQADACALPFPAATFDHVFCVEAMFHFASRRRFLREAACVLRPGGTLAISDILLRWPAAALPWTTDVMTSVIRRDYGPWPELWTKPSDLLNWAAESGLVILDQQDWTAATLPTYRIVAPDPRPELRRQPSAGDILRWLHTNGCLMYRAFSFRRQSP